MLHDDLPQYPPSESRENPGNSLPDFTPELYAEDHPAENCAPPEHLLVKIDGRGPNSIAARDYRAKRTQKVVVWLTPHENAQFERNRKDFQGSPTRAAYARTLLLNGTAATIDSLIEEMRQLTLAVRDHDPAVVGQAEEILLRALSYVVTP